MATAEYYVNRPAEPEQVNQTLITVVDKLLSDLIAGTMTSGILKVFVQSFGPAAAAEFLSREVTREGDFIFIDGERFIADVSAKAAMLEFFVPRLMTLLGTAIASPTLVYMGAVIVGGATAQFLWHNFLEPGLASLEAYVGTAQTRLELYDSSGAGSSGVLYRGGLDDLSRIDAVKYLIGYADSNPAVTRKPDVGSHIDFDVNGSSVAGYDLLYANFLQKIADPLGVRRASTSTPTAMRSAPAGCARTMASWCATSTATGASTTSPRCSAARARASRSSRCSTATTTARSTRPTTGLPTSTATVRSRCRAPRTTMFRNVSCAAPHKSSANFAQSLWII